MIRPQKSLEYRIDILYHFSLLARLSINHKNYVLFDSERHSFWENLYQGTS
jgi:hypothetical protein